MTDTKLTTGDFCEADDPISLFATWLDAACENEPNNPTATALATVDSDGLPDVRMVLMKAFDVRGFVFYTNFESAKGHELLATGKAAMCFHWKSLGRQVRLRGPVSEVSREEADGYFASRSRGSRIGAWASDQSQPLESRVLLEDRVRELEEQYPGEDIPRPQRWSGFRIAPVQIEFWQEGMFRLHDRIVFMRTTQDEAWTKTRLYP